MERLTIDVGTIVQHFERNKWLQNATNEQKIKEPNMYLYKIENVAYWADTDEGLGSDGFYEYGGEVCRQFVCPDCPKWNKEYEDCDDDDSLCIDRMDEFFKTHELYCTREGYYEVWRARKKEQKNETD